MSEPKQNNELLQAILSVVPESAIREMISGEIRDKVDDVVRVVRCKDCKHRILQNHYAECDLDTGDPYQLGREADEDDWFCADGEKREE